MKIEIEVDDRIAAFLKSVGWDVKEYVESSVKCELEADLNFGAEAFLDLSSLVEEHKLKEVLSDLDPNKYK